MQDVEMKIMVQCVKCDPKYRNVKFVHVDVDLI